MFSTTQLDIMVSARNLNVKKDPGKQMSVRCALLVSNGLKENFIETDKTEFSEDILNPEWSKRFLIAFKFTELQTLKFDVYLSVNKIGETRISMVELLTAKDGFIMKAIKSGTDKIGRLLIQFKECEKNKEILMQFSGKNLDKKDLFGLSDPYLVISKTDRNGNLIEVHKTEVIKQSISPVWKAFKINVKTLCHSNPETNLKFDCFDWDSDIKIKDKSDYIGSFSTTLDQLLNGADDDKCYELINPDKLAQNINTYKNSGLISLDQISVTFCDSFIDYLRKGLQLHANIAIDFTAALNLNEFKNRNKINDLNDCHIFKTLIQGFWQIIKQYNRENLWTASGFNAIFQNNESNDCFEFNDNGFENCEQIITQFDSLLASVKPISGKSSITISIKTKQQSIKPLNLEPIINKSVESIEKHIESDSNRMSRYSLLIILTSDLTKDSLKNLEDFIAKTNSSPITVLIIDINLNGNTKELAEITKILNNSHLLDDRDNIEVISLQSLQLQCNDWQIGVNKAIREVLNRVPDQFMKYVALQQNK